MSQWGLPLILSALTAMTLAASGTFAYGEEPANQSLIPERMDKETHTLLIDKLERVLELMDAQSDKKIDVMLRLADLHAERARLEDMAEGASDAKNKEAKQDRARSIELYKVSLSQSSAEVQGKVIFQMAQLFDLQGEYNKAHDLYLKASKNSGGKFSPDVVGQAYLKLGDISFNKIKYDEAQKYFLKALNIKETPRRDYIRYRLAWCAFHQGKTGVATLALSNILRNPEDSSGETQQSFREEASRDLATFVSRGKAGPEDVQMVADLSPISVRRDNLVYLADELTRLGKKNAAVYVITVAGPAAAPGANSDKDPSRDKIEEHLKLAELQYDIGKKDQVVSELDQMVTQWRAEPCKIDEDCALLKDRFRKLVVSWGKAEEKQPSVNLVKAYSFYNLIFYEAEMNYWAALAARKNSMWKESALFYRTASTLALEQMKNGQPIKSKGENRLGNIAEGSLLGEIEVAELAHDTAMRDQAYGHYLEVRPNGEKRLEVLYQRAHLVYEQEKYSDAAHLFREIALKKGDKSTFGIREKAAHLSLDSLVLAKNDDLVQTWASEYSQVFHQSRAGFLSIAKKAVMNRVVRAINDPNASSDQLRSALVSLSTFPVREASKEEQISFYKNRLIIAERLQDLGETKRAIVALLAIRGLSQVDRQYALSREEWIDELTLNFPEAYRLLLKLPLVSVSREERILKLAMLAELAKMNPDRHYQEYLKIGTDKEKVQAVIAKIIRHTNSPKIFMMYESRLHGNTDLLGTLALEVFALHHDYRFAKNILGLPGVWQSPSGKVLSRFVFLKHFHEFSQELMRNHLDHSTDIKRNLDRYVSLLRRTEVEVDRAIKSQDWVLQVIALNDVAYHYKRFAVELFSMKVPRGFNPEQRSRYESLVSQQAHAYKSKSDEVSRKIADLWNDTRTIDGLFSDYEKTHGELRKALYDELRIVARVAPPQERQNFVKTLVYSQAKPSPAAIEAALVSVTQNPFNTDKIERLKILEERVGSETIVAFLDARLGQINGVKK